MQARRALQQGRLILAGLISVWAVNGQAADNPFAEGIRKTEPLTPEQEQKTFHLPPGFQIQLVASEPQIGKPMNMAFDARGRLWLTQSREYPFAGTNQPFRDQIKVLSDFSANGCAKKVTTFAKELNLPIGLMPYRDGVIAFSIPNIYYFADTNHDGQADTKELILGKFGYDRDTHGLTSSFRRGFDGWIYADHGFNNNTTLTAKDGSSITMNSGNTYRFRPDGSRVEQFTWGQVNPFGLMFDPLGDLWSSDCHSSPVYMLVRDGRYPSFGKEHDGLGFAPNICTHVHGSTAIAGMVYYAATNFPPEYRNNTFIGNVMTCRINRDSSVEHGSTRIPKEEPDFLSCDDPWFRPVDVQLGPDGALYVADFYNRIIGHYEVPLDHPGRDRERGRIWRISYVGLATNRASRLPTSESVDLSRASTSKLIKELGRPNIAVRNVATTELTDRIGQPAVPAVEKMVRSPKSTSDQKVHGMWVLQRLGALKPEILVNAARDPDRTMRIHAMRVLSESFRDVRVLPEPYRGLVFEGLQDKDAYVQRAAADAVGQHTHGTEHGDFEPTHRLMELRGKINSEDSELMYVCRRALRNHLAVPGGFAHLETLTLKDADSKALAEIALAVTNGESASFILKHLKTHPESREQLTILAKHAARYARESQIDDFAALIREKFADDLNLRLALFKSMQEGVAQRGGKLSEAMRTWAAELTESLLTPVDASTETWVIAPLPGSPSASPWILQKRKSVDRDREATFLSSAAPNGETFTGKVRSRPFTIPPKLKFFIAGHDDPPDKPLGNKNYIQLLAADSGEVITNAPPPRNDSARAVTWDLSAYAGKQGRLEIVDGNTGTGFAWLAVGRFQPPVVPLPTTDPNKQGARRDSAAELVRTVPLPQFAKRFEASFNDAQMDEDFRAESAETLLALDSTNYVAMIAATAKGTNQPMAFREDLALMLAEQNSPVAREAVLATMPTASQRSQIKLALPLAGNAAGAEALLAATEAKQISPQIIADRAVKERLAGAKLPKFDERFASLTKDVSPVSVTLQKEIDARRTAYARVQTSADRGHAVFDKACSICHQLDGKGAVVGPQLDGIGNRGLDRIIEDVLDPSRNIDPAFRPSLVTLKDDTSITGLQRREEGEVLLFVDSLGKEITVAKKEITERRESQLSLMPSNFADALTKEEFNDLLAFLLAHGPKADKSATGQ